jgi:hypothetical protein
MLSPFLRALLTHSKPVSTVSVSAGHKAALNMADLLRLLLSSNLGKRIRGICLRESAKVPHAKWEFTCKQHFCVGVKNAFDSRK